MIRWMVALLVLLLGTYAAAAQEPGLSELSPDEILILNNINALRLRENLVHLVPDPRLNAIADQFVDDLQARPIGELGEVFRTRDDRSIDDLLAEAGYNRYNNGYVVDFIPIILRDIAPAGLIEFWRTDWRAAPEERTLLSRLAVRQGETILPFFSPLYREIGLSVAFNRTNERYYYVIIFAAQPNVLPIIITDPDDLSPIPAVVDTREVLLYLHDERVNRFGVGDTMGAVSVFRISETGEQLECPTTTPDSSLGWEAYVNERPYTLNAGVGIKTVYVQMCDEVGRSTLSSTSVNFQAPPTNTPPVIAQSVTPDVMGIANATQTAAASATAYAPYALTVEAILTQTAAAPLATATP